MNEKMDVEAAAEARRLKETATVEISRSAPSRVHRRAEVKKAARSCAGAPSFRPRAEEARPKDVVARGSGAAAP